MRPTVRPNSLLKRTADLARASGEMRRGVAIMLIAVLFIALIDPSAKYAGRSPPVLQVVWGRYAFAALTAIVLFRPPADPRRWGIRRLPLQVLRAGLLLSATACNVLALRSLGLVENQAILMLSPLVITAVSLTLLGERASLPAIAGLIAGFVGALMVIRPGADVVKPGALFALGHVLSYASYVLLSRRLLRTESALSLNMLAVFLPASVLSLVVPSVWVWPVDAGTWFALVAVGFVGGVGHFLLVLAHRHAPASTLAPLTYTQLCWAMSGGLLIFGEIPSLTTAIGALVILVAGLLVLLSSKT